VTCETWHIVIVDDNPDDRAEVRRLLLKGSDHRYAFTEAETGAAGLGALRDVPTAHHRCLVLDYNLPDMAAPEFLAALAGRPGGADWPVVVFTGGDSAATGRSALRAGAHDYVGKDWMTQQVMVRAVENATERWAMARELRQQSIAAQASEQQFRTLADAIPHLCFITRPDGGAEWFNAGWYAYTGTTLEEMRGAGWQRVHDPRFLPEVTERWQCAIARGNPFEMIFPLKGASGGYRQFLTRIMPVKDENGVVTRWFGTNTDITTLMDAEVALARRELELQTLADNTPDILARYDRDLRHVFVNASVERVTGLAASDFLGKTHREMGMPIEVCEMWDAALTAVFDKGQTVCREFTCAALAEARHFQCTLIPERGPRGEVESVLGVTRDRTDEKNAQDALRAADRRKDEFLATLAHELRNPLAPLRTGLKVLQLTQDPSMVERTHLMMERQLGQTVRLIDDLLDVSRITSGKVVLRPARIELQAAILTAIEAVQPLLDAAAQVLKADLPAEPIWIQADPTRISQVVNNLLANAAKYSTHGSEISLGVRPADSTVVITVADNGVGIPQHMLAQIFEMFTQVDRTLDRAQGGLGIGLALVKRLVEMHGGTVSAASPGLGAGSTMTLRLPMLGDPDATLHDPVPAWAAAAACTPLRVLVVDDNDDAARSLAELVSLYGHDTRVADCGTAALAMICEFRPALVFLDIGMPGINGYETARRLRAVDPSCCLTLVALTGWGAESDRTRAKDAGFDHHFTKPPELHRIDRVLEQVALRQAGSRLAS
jgi:PAS domain S-box-containing protein